MPQATSTADGWLIWPGDGNQLCLLSPKHGKHMVVFDQETRFHALLIDSLGRLRFFGEKSHGTFRPLVVPGTGEIQVE